MHSTATTSQTAAPALLTDRTLKVYSKTAQAYIERTRDVDMSHERGFFLEKLPVPVTQARILDAGCGSARDALAFQKLGAYVMAIDGCAELAKAAAALGVPTSHKQFSQLTWTDAFEGIWASASLLHLPEPELEQALVALRKALVPGGVLCVVMKEGVGQEVLPDGRFFRYTDPDDMRAHFHKAGLEEAGWGRTACRLGADVQWLTMRGIRPKTKE